jgi:flagellar basal body rod protein FlgC
MISALGRAQSGMLDASLRMDVAANNIANMSTAGFRPSQVVSVENPNGGVTSVVTQAGFGQGYDPGASGTDLVAEMASMMLARLAFSANISSFASARDSARRLFEIVA